MPRERGRILAKKKGARIAPRPKARLGQSRYFNPTTKMMFAGLYARLMRNWYVCPDVRLVVAMLKIHCWLDASHRNAASGISPLVVSFTASTVPRTALSIVNVPPVPAKTALAFEMDPPEAPHTLNFTGIVLPPLRG